MISLVSEKWVVSSLWVASDFGDKKFVRGKPTFVKTYILTETSHILAHRLLNIGFTLRRRSLRKPTFARHSGNALLKLKGYISLHPNKYALLYLHGCGWDYLSAIRLIFIISFKFNTQRYIKNRFDISRTTSQSNVVFIPTSF